MQSCVPMAHPPYLSSVGCAHRMPMPCQLKVVLNLLGLGSKVAGVNTVHVCKVTSRMASNTFDVFCVCKLDETS